MVNSFVVDFAIRDSCKIKSNTQVGGEGSDRIDRHQLLHQTAPVQKLNSSFGTDEQYFVIQIKYFSVIITLYLVQTHWGMESTVR